MVKAAQVDLLRSSTVCPGKYVVIVGGDTGDVKAAMQEGLARGGGNLGDFPRISHLAEQPISALHGNGSVGKTGGV